MRECPRCHIVHRDGIGLCQTCRRYERNGGVWHPLPPFGDVRYDSEGRPICHICGMALNKLAEHVRRKHHMSTEEYRSKFGLMRKLSNLCAPAYRDKMRRHARRTRTYAENFAPVWEGEIPVGRRNPHWSAQETNRRRPVQRLLGRLRHKTTKPKEQK